MFPNTEYIQLLYSISYAIVIEINPLGIFEIIRFFFAFMSKKCTNAKTPKSNIERGRVIR